MAYPAPTAKARGLWALVLAPLIARALDRSQPAPARLHAVEMIAPILDSLLTPARKSISRVIEENARPTHEYMRLKGYWCPPPPRGDTRAWIHENLKRQPGEGILAYLDRVSTFLARILAPLALVTIGDVAEHMDIEELY